MHSLALRLGLKTVERSSLKFFRFSSRGLSVSSMNGNKEKTFQLQDKLPSLPVPSLAQTCEKYLDSVKPHLTREEFLQTQFLVNEFASGVGKDLHRKLEKRAKSMRNWLEPWWEDLAYLTPRYPSAPLINVAGPLPITDMWPVQNGTQIKRAAVFTHAYLLIWQRLYRGEIPIDRMGPTPLCMFQFSRLFSCCKIPGKEKDSLRTSFVTAPHSSPRHIIVQTRGRIFSCTVLDENMEPLTPPEIERQLQEIQSIANSPGIGIGSLTGERRDTWHELRERLISLDRNNQKNLDVIETSLFALVLDENVPETEIEVCKHAIHGDSKNRWFDKAVSVLVFKSGRLASQCDHAPFDGVVEIDSIILVVKYLEEKGGEWQGSSEIKNYFAPQELVFKADDVIHRAVEDAVQKYQQLAATVNVIAHSTQQYGKGFIKPYKIHPDTFVQMAIQLSYYRLHRKPAPTYETAQTRQFYHGRTDTNLRKLRLFREACKKHIKLMKEAVDGQGIDRHLLGLQLIAASEGMPTPAIFTEKAWTASGGGGNFVLSTSCVGFSKIIGGCAAMVKDGYGAFYSIEDNKINFVLATFTNSAVTDLNKWRDSLEESFRDMRHLLLTSKL
ncbi:peroxisomal carnitine O-octanoyltransferase-like isoform X3 [Orbicella faveolata]|uniref:peroxisomal carnitine O-octanoyltransferase-like isoform X3 n=1 Tax=Orbicella faveolata TaxID=48498 RepID=UPI0009E49243|nr:peroxisomal carnitine O-octanoyltransferase-like isoform X3 [Orbicella faveolata]